MSESINNTHIQSDKYTSDLYFQSLKNTKEREAYNIGRVLGIAIGENFSIQNKLSNLESEKDYYQYKSTHDVLTGIYNLFGIQEALQEKDITNYDLILFDLDNFKHVNDLYGYDAGDELLKYFAGITLQEATRQDDLVARIGGDEFIILLNKDKRTNQETSFNVKMDSIENRLKKAFFKTLKNNKLYAEGGFNISFGRANYQTGDTFKSMKLRAEKAMKKYKYQQKTKML